MGTITMTGEEYDAMRAENERLKEDRDSHQRVAIRAMEERDSLRAELESIRGRSLPHSTGRTLAIQSRVSMGLTSDGRASQRCAMWMAAQCLCRSTPSLQRRRTR